MPILHWHFILNKMVNSIMARKWPVVILIFWVRSCLSAYCRTKPTTSDTNTEHKKDYRAAYHFTTRTNGKRPSKAHFSRGNIITTIFIIGITRTATAQNGGTPYQRTWCTGRTKARLFRNTPTKTAIYGPVLSSLINTTRRASAKRAGRRHNAADCQNKSPGTIFMVQHG